MEDITLKRLLGGVANGRDVPAHWEGLSEWIVPGTDTRVAYQIRHYYEGDKRFNVWTAVGVTEPEFVNIMAWHREMYRGDLVAAQKDLLHESMTAATNYTNVIMVVGYAALFSLWTQMSGSELGDFTPLTSLVAAIFLGVSVLAFVGWELFGMIVRGVMNIQLVKAVDNPSEFEARIKEYREKRAEFGRRFQAIWVIVLGTAAGFAALAFIVMMVALLHGAWMAASCAC